VAVASDDAAARSQVAALVNDLGFDPVEMEGQNAWLSGATGPFFGRRHSSAEMSAIASASRRANRLTW
jgi:predicted dinucleotide-binding enzyme